MFKKLKSGAVVMTACVMLAGTVFTTYGEPENGKEKYYSYDVDENVKVTEENNYLTDNNGYRCCELISLVDGKYMCSDNTGAIVKNRWIDTLDGWMYFDANGYAMINQWFCSNGTWYYLNGKGIMHTGWLSYKNKWYYMDATGAMHTGWLRNGDTCYYLNASGEMVTGWVSYGGKTYYMSASGAMKRKSWVKDGDTWYYMDATGAMKTGWLNYKNQHYYLKDSGAMACNEKITIGVVEYTFDAQGVRVAEKFLVDKDTIEGDEGLPNVDVIDIGTPDDWAAAGGHIGGEPAYVICKNPGNWVLEANGLWWYRHTDGTYTQNNWELINNKWYYFDSKGYMFTGWLNKNGTWYYMDETGAMKTGWFKSGNALYYLKNSGAMASNEKLNVNGAQYTFEASGACVR